MSAAAHHVAAPHTDQHWCRFEWLDGPLTLAAEAGSWLLLENANLCSPAVLDRLNSLLEPEGSLLLNEAGSVGGQPRLLRPHPGFRVFMTVHPGRGALSQAMRNRSIELYLPAPGEARLVSWGLQHCADSVH